MQPSILFTWKAPTTRVDGSELTPQEVAALEFLLFESGDLIVEDIGEPTFNLLMDDQPQGQKSYTVAARQYGLVGPQTEPYVVNFQAPAAPTDLAAEWIAGSEVSASGLVG